MTDRPEMIRVEFLRDLQLRRYPVVKGETLDTWRFRIDDGGTLTIDAYPIPPAYYSVVASWPAGSAAPPLTPAQRRRNLEIVAEHHGSPIAREALRQLDAAADSLRALGFADVMGPAWELLLADGSTVQVAGADASGEAVEPIAGLPAFAHRLRDPMDHATLIETVERSTLAEVLAEVERWIAAADSLATPASGGQPRTLSGESRHRRRGREPVPSK